MKKFECVWENITTKHYEIVNRRTTEVQTDKEEHVMSLIHSQFGKKIKIISIKEIREND